jgi:RHS repeat-associated protein
VRKISYSYFDGLGRPVQSVNVKHSPLDSLDIIMTQTYDNQGRPYYGYEPFKGTARTGAYVHTVASGTPFTKSEYYSDPLSRSWKVTPPNWYASIFTYGANIASEVQKTFNAGGTFYAANLLHKTTVEDPNGNKSISYTDKKGRLVLSRRTDNAGNAANTANTYNFYDNKDRLVRVMPPGSGYNNTNLLFKYQYDQADNMTSKDVPDAAAMTMKYDARNLMALMQDGNMGTSTWLGTKYDVYGNPVKTGFATGNDANTFTISSTNLLTETFYNDTINSSLIYKGKVRKSKVKVLDGAVTPFFITTDFYYDTHGRVFKTGANNHTLGRDSFLFLYDWADNRLRSSRFHKRVTSDPSFTTIVERTVIDRAGRPVANKHNLNSAATDTYLSRLKYDFEDQLIEKNLGYTSTASTLQSIDYAYNAQGWLKSINQSSLGGTTVALSACVATPSPNFTPTTPDGNDLFYLELRYDSLFSNTSGGITGMGGTIQKNGNISQMAWRVQGRERQAYGFTYDYLDRLTAATDFDVNNAGTANANSRYNESLTYADARGNISGLTRRGGTFAASCWSYGIIDNLTYTYHPATNKIKTITDSGTTKGFKSGTGGDYIYDVNGNMTTDPHKGMTITYNHLNLPKMFTFAGGKTIEILYDAAGTKLKKTVKTGAVTNLKQEYLSGIEYRRDTIEAIYHAEGRVFYTTPTTKRYEYSIKDHLGNARIAFTDKDGDGIVEIFNTTANEVLQENHYYPFGLNMDGPWMNDVAVAAYDNKYQYNGKEWNDDFGLNLNDYGARWYDAAVGRWWSVDPLGALTPAWSNYAYTFNNPINFIDPTGMTGEAVGADGLTDSQWMESSRPGSKVSADEQRKKNRENEIEDGRQQEDPDEKRYIANAKNGHGDIETSAFLVDKSGSMVNASVFSKEVASFARVMKKRTGGKVTIEVYAPDVVKDNYFRRESYDRAVAHEKQKLLIYPKNIREKATAFIDGQSFSVGGSLRVLDLDMFTRTYNSILTELNKNGISQSKSFDIDIHFGHKELVYDRAKAYIYFTGIKP